MGKKLKLTRRLMWMTLLLFAVMTGGVFVLQRHFLGQAIRSDALFYLDDLYATLLFRSLRGNMLVGRPDKARELYTAMREFLDDQHNKVRHRPKVSVFSPQAAAPLTVAELVVIRRTGEEAFVDNDTIRDVNERTWENFPEQEVPRKTRWFKTEGFGAALKTGKSVSRETSTPQGPQLWIYKPLPNTKKCFGCHGSKHRFRGVAAMRVPLEAMNDRIRAESLRLALLLGLGAIACCAMLLWLLRRWVLGPLEVMGGLAQRVASGDLSPAPPPQGPDEMAVLHQQFGQMLEGLRRTFQPDAASKIPTSPRCLMVCRPKNPQPTFDMVRRHNAAFQQAVNQNLWLVGFDGPQAEVHAALCGLALFRMGDEVRLWETEACGFPPPDFFPVAGGVSLAASPQTVARLESLGFEITPQAEGKIFHLTGVTQGSPADRLAPELFGDDTH